MAPCIALARIQPGRAVGVSAAAHWQPFHVKRQDARGGL